ncbi:MAG TPA: RluA family pseudouridine synthase [Candidatus Omnitrophota bacterium]|nr:RluA family pseudouridine synthase [Candidatus Omnitrophota bacterium]HPT07487.1 RluA family pseudouridine synthase [Candidatus Omnitrophota bacterium]
MNIPVLYEDSWLIIVDKPSGLLTIPTPKRESRTLTSILDDDALEKGASYRVHPCHRLDRETSGVIMYAKGKSMQQKMMHLFHEKKVKKTYLAFVRGHLEHAEGQISKPIEGAPAVTQYRLLEKRNGYSVVEVIPVTGRTNQIRIHFGVLGHPILGETRFAFRRDFILRAKRLCLHAQSVEFPHPITKQPVFIQAPLPQDLTAFLESH